MTLTNFSDHNARMYRHLDQLPICLYLVQPELHVQSTIVTWSYDICYCFNYGLILGQCNALPRDYLEQVGQKHNINRPGL